MELDSRQTRGFLESASTVGWQLDDKMRAAALGRPGVKARLARTLGLDGNPMRRATDRAEAWIRAGLLVVFMIAGPIAAVAMGEWTAHALSPATIAQPHAVQAVLLQPAADPAARAAAVWGAQVWASARWKSADGAVRTGEVPAPAGAAAGTSVTVWLNAAGQVTGPPQRGEADFVAAVTGVVTLGAMAFSFLALLWLIQRFLNWRRLAAWEAAWRAVGPRWTGHGRRH